MSDLQHNPSEHADLAAAIAAGVQRKDILAATAAILADAQAELNAREPSCRACGRCCDFAAAGHRLFVTTAELALLAADEPLPPIAPLVCPFQTGNHCTAREHRPLGCRVYFCQAASGDPFDVIYERHHAELVELHRRCNLPYFYVELTAGLSIYRNSR